MLSHKVFARRFVGLSVAVAIAMLVCTASGQDGAARKQVNVFMSGHSAFGLIMPAMVDQIARALGRTHRYNLQMGLGSSLKWRLSGKGSEQDRAGKAKTLNVLQELPAAKTLGAGQRYDTLVVTEAVPFLGHIQHGDSVGNLRAFYDLLMRSDPQGTVYFYDTWDKVGAGSFPQWAKSTRDKHVLWQCVAAKVNADPKLARNPVQLLPAGVALARAVEAAESGKLPGVAAKQLFADDQHHLSPLGNYFIALVVYGSLYRSSPEGAPTAFDTPQGRQAGFVGESSARPLQALAWETVRDFYAKPPKAPSMSQCRAKTAAFCDGGACPAKLAQAFAD